MTQWFGKKRSAFEATQKSNLHFILCNLNSFHACRYVMSNLNISGRRIVTNEEVEQVIEKYMDIDLIPLKV